MTLLNLHHYMDSMFWKLVTTYKIKETLCFVGTFTLALY